jgi:hypothetical protein
MSALHAVIARMKRGPLPSKSTASTGPKATLPKELALRLARNLCLSLYVWPMPDTQAATYAATAYSLSASDVQAFLDSEFAVATAATDLVAVNNLAVCYLFGVGGVRRDEKKAVSMLQTAVKNTIIQVLPLLFHFCFVSLPPSPVLLFGMFLLIWRGMAPIWRQMFVVRREVFVVLIFVRRCGS